MLLSLAAAWFLPTEGRIRRILDDRREVERVARGDTAKATAAD
jgi:hypothetical protein